MKKLALLLLLGSPLFGQAFYPTPNTTGPICGNGSGNVSVACGLPLTAGSVAITQSAYQTSMGDSITTTNCTGATASQYCYTALISSDLGTTLTNLGVSGQLSCDLANTQAVSSVLSTSDNNPVYTLMIGTNDANTKGAGSYEAVFKTCHQAAIAWVAVANKYAANSTNCTDTGTWFAYTGYSLNGESSTTNGSTKTCNITTYGGPVYAWYFLHDGSGGTFTYSVDGGSATSLAEATNPPIATQNGGTSGWGLISVPVLAGNHSIVFTVTSATGASNSISIGAIGTTAQFPTRNAPFVLVGGVPRQQGDSNSAATSAYNSDALADVQLLSSQGLNVAFVNVRNYLCSYLVSSVCYGFSLVPDMQSGSGMLHPINAGYNELKLAFEQAGQLISSPSIGANPTFTSVTTTALSVGNVSYSSNSYYPTVNRNNNSSTTALDAGLSLYSLGGYGIDLGYSGGGYNTRVYGNNGAITLSNAGTTPATGQSSYTDLLSVSTVSGHEYFGGGTAPTLTSCGTSPTLSSDATDVTGTVTIGSGGTGCTITFGHAFTSPAPHSIVTSRGATITSYTPSTTTLVIVGTGTFDYLNIGK